MEWNYFLSELKYIRCDATGKYYFMLGRYFVVSMSKKLKHLIFDLIIFTTATRETFEIKFTIHI
jgi:hypothetical protein